MNLFFERKIDLNKKKKNDFLLPLLSRDCRLRKCEWQLENMEREYVLRTKFTLHHISASQKTFFCMQH